MINLLKICSFGLLAFVFSACDETLSCNNGKVIDKVIKDIEAVYPNPTPKLTNIVVEDKNKENTMFACKAEVSNNNIISSVEYTVRKIGDIMRIKTNIKRKEIKDKRKEIYSNVSSVQKAITTKVFAYNIDTKLPKAPNGKSWGAWIMEIAGLDADNWIASSNGVSLKMCSSGKSPLIVINTSTGVMHFNPSKLLGDKKTEDFCKKLREGYRTKNGNGDKKIPLSTTMVEF